MNNEKLAEQRQQISDCIKATDDPGVKIVLDCADQMLARIQAGAKEVKVEMRIRGDRISAVSAAANLVEAICAHLGTYGGLSFTIYGTPGKFAFMYKQDTQATD